MDAQSAAHIIAAIRDSIQHEPSQFNIQVTVTGQQIVSHGGTGLKITATGGGAGSTTIGQRLSLDGTQIEIARLRGSQVMDQQMAALVESLDRMIAQLQSAHPDKNVLKRLFDSILNKWVPDVITSVIGTVLAKSVGL